MHSKRELSFDSRLFLLLNVAGVLKSEVYNKGPYAKKSQQSLQLLRETRRMNLCVKLVRVKATRSSCDRNSFKFTRLVH